jgi:hypothetical protein
MLASWALQVPGPALSVVPVSFGCTGYHDRCAVLCRTRNVVAKNPVVFHVWKIAPLTFLECCPTTFGSSHAPSPHHHRARASHEAARLAIQREACCRERFPRRAQKARPLDPFVIVSFAIPIGVHTKNSKMLSDSVLPAWRAALN